MKKKSRRSCYFFFFPSTSLLVMDIKNLEEVLNERLYSTTLDLLKLSRYYNTRIYIYTLNKENELFKRWSSQLDGMKSNSIDMKIAGPYLEQLDRKICKEHKKLIKYHDRRSKSTES